MEERPYYQNSGYQDGYPQQGSMTQNPTYMNPTMNSNRGVVPPHGSMQGQFPTNTAPDGMPYGYPGYMPPTNVVNSGFPQPQNQYSQQQTYQGYKSANPVGTYENPPNPVSNPSWWNQPTHNYDAVFANSHIPPNAVMYPHLKIGRSKIDSCFVKNVNESSCDSPMTKRSKISEKRKYSKSKSPEPRKHKKKSSKRRSKSPSSSSWKYLDKRYERGSRSPNKHSRSELRKPKVIIDPNRIPTPPPPPIVGSYGSDNLKKLNEQITFTDKETSDSSKPNKDLTSKEKVSLSCLLEAVMENTGQGKSQLGDPKVKKEIISNCESKIRHLYKRRMTGLGAFIPDLVTPLHPIAHVSPLTAVFSHFTYNCEEEESNEWHAPDIIIPVVKEAEKKDLKKSDKPNFPPQNRIESGGKFLNENTITIPTLMSGDEAAPAQNQELNAAKHPSAIGAYATNPNESNLQNVYPPYRGGQGWPNPGPYPPSTQPEMIGHPSEMSMMGQPPQAVPSYPPYMPPRPEFMPPQHGYPMRNYSPMRNYPPVQRHPSNMRPAHPGLYHPSQPVPVTNNYYQAQSVQQPTNNKNVNNLILLSNNPLAVGKNVNNCQMDHNTFSKGKIDNDTNKLPRSTNEAKEKLLRKVWQLRKSADYVHLPSDQLTGKELEGEFYKKLNYADMQDDTQLDTIHDYQLINLRERIETCLEGKVPDKNSGHRSKDRRWKGRERDKPRDRERGRDKEKERARDRDRRRHDRISADEKRKHRTGESSYDFDRRRIRESPSADEIIEINSDEERNQINSLPNKGLLESSEPTEKPLANKIIESLGAEIRKTQEKSDLYKSIINSLELGDKAYKRLYCFRNTVLMKIEKDNRMKMVVPKDNLKEVVVAVHKNFHDVQIDELSKLLRDTIYPIMTYISKCMSKVVSECPTCIEQKKLVEKEVEEKKDDIQKGGKKTEKQERKPEKKINRLREIDRKTSRDKDRRISKDRKASPSSLKGRRGPPRNLEKERKNSTNIDGRPSGYEKATKLKGSETNEKPNKSALSSITEEKSKGELIEKSVKVSHELHDKALEFKKPLEPIRKELLVETQNSLQEVLSDTITGKSVTKPPEESNKESSENQCEKTKNELSSPGQAIEMTLPNFAATEKTVVLTKDEVQISDTINANNQDGVFKKPTDKTNSEEVNKEEKADGDANESNPREVDRKSDDLGYKKETPKLDFKGRVRQVQMSSSECKEIIAALESTSTNANVDSSYLMKGGMLCRKTTVGNATEVKIVALSNELEDFVNIVHTMSAVHTSAVKVLIFFTKHFTQIDDLESKVNEIVSKCSICNSKVG